MPTKTSSQIILEVAKKSDVTELTKTDIKIWNASASNVLKVLEENGVKMELSLISEIVLKTQLMVLNANPDD